MIRDDLRVQFTGTGCMFSVAMSFVPWAYIVFYASAFVAAGSVFLYLSRPTQEALGTSLVLLSACSIAGLVGAHVAGVSWSELAAWTRSGELPASVGKDFIGLSLGSALASIVLRRAGRLRESILDRTAPSVLIALILGSVGCLFVGCCYGVVTDLPWAVLHPISGHAVHPAPIYEMLAALAALGVYVRLEGGDLPQDVRGGQALSVYLALRFLLDFARAGEAFAGLLEDQWLAVAGIVALALLTKHRSPDIPPIFRTGTRASIFRVEAALMALLWASWVGATRLSLDLLEAHLTGLTLLATTFVFATRLVRNLGYGTSPARLAASAAIVASVLGMQQVPLSVTSETSSSEATFVEVGLGGALGRYYRESRSCEGDLIERRNYAYRQGGAEVAVSRSYSDSRGLIGRAGFYGSGGSLRSVDGGPGWGSGNGESSEIDDVTGAYFGVNMETRWVGFGLGIHGMWGNVGRFDMRDTAAPFFYLRGGRRDNIFADLYAFAGEPGFYPNGSLVGIGLGFGLGRSGDSFRDVSVLRLGISDAGFYVDPEIVFQNGLTLRPGFSFAGKNWGSIRLSARYRLRVSR